jgi:hypothetical protein
MNALLGKGQRLEELNNTTAVHQREQDSTGATTTLLQALLALDHGELRD